jgi:hypothetical protein
LVLSMGYGPARCLVAVNGGFGSTAVDWGIPIRRGLFGPGHHHVDVAAAAPGADEPPAPLGDGGFGAVPLGHLRGVGPTRRPQALHQTISRTRAAAAFPSVNRWSRCGFHRSAEDDSSRFVFPGDEICFVNYTLAFSLAAEMWGLILLASAEPPTYIKGTAYRSWQQPQAHQSASSR